MPDRWSFLRTEANRAIDINNVPGAAVAVTDGRELLFAEGFGRKGLSGSSSIQADTRFAIASISKGMTALVTGQTLREHGLSYDIPVKSILRNFALPDAYASEHCTVRDLLLHRAGLPSGDTMWWRRPLSEEDIIDLLPHVPPGKPFRTAFQYQNLHFAGVSALLRTLTGKSWHELIREKLFVPLGMHSAGSTVAELQRDANHARPVGPNGFGPQREWQFLELYGGASAGQVCCSAPDLARYCRMMINNGEEFIHPDIHKDCTTPQWFLSQEVWPEMLFHTVGLGWLQQVYRGEICWSGAGGMDGFVSHCYVLPKRGLAAVAFANRTSACVAQALAILALDVAAGFDPLPWIDRYTDQKRAYRKAGEERQAKRHARVDRTIGLDQTCIGTYTHPACGEVTITAEGDALRVRYYSIDAQALPYDRNAYGLFDADDQIEHDITFSDDRQSLQWRVMNSNDVPVFRRRK